MATSAAGHSINAATIRLHGEELVVALEVITPERATQDLLNQREDQRPLSTPQVARLSSDMSTSNFVLNGEPVIYDERGKLADGQHRLQAVVASGRTIMMLTVRGVKETAMATIDGGRMRTLANQIVIDMGTDEQIAKLLPTAFKFISFYAKGVSQNETGARQQIRTLEEDYNRLVSAAKFARGFTKAKTAFIKPGLVTAVAYLGYLAGKRIETETFLNQLREGFGWGSPETDSPAYVTSEHLNGRENVLSLQKSADRYLIFKKVLHGLQAHLEGRSMKVLVMNDNSKAPVITNADPEKVARKFNLS
jgi:hypothetical protein